MDCLHIYRNSSMHAHVHTHIPTPLQAQLHSSDTHKDFLSEKHSPLATSPCKSSDGQKNGRIWGMEGQEVQCVSVNRKQLERQHSCKGLDLLCCTGWVLSPLGTTGRSLGNCDSPPVLLLLLPDGRAFSWL